ncbi:hypothetical protein DB347_17015 [Opitutaceae bacterium EW11]|nr:hypothetical protein DB347_17015 [Opitutaceae bacterium EW11]
MSLTLATLIPALLLVALGALFLVSNSLIISMCKAFPRSKAAAGVLFGAGAAWFLYAVSHLSEADFGEYRVALFIGFAVVAALSFFYVPDFLAVRGACILMLMMAMPLLEAGYMIYQPAQIYLYKIAVYAGIVLALYLGASPFRLRDFFQWLFARQARARALGGVLLGYGLVLAAVAFTY